MAAMFGVPQASPLPVPSPPTVDQDAVQARANEAARLRGLSGKASTYLTDPSVQRQPARTAARTLGAA